VTQTGRGDIMAKAMRQDRHRYKRQQVVYQNDYIYGATVPLPDYHPEPAVPEPEPEVRQKPKVKLDPQIKQNRRRAQNISVGYACYILAISVIAVAVCVLYLQLHVSNGNQADVVAGLRNQLAEMTEHNNATYHSIIRSVNMEVVRAHAVGEMGLIPIRMVQVIEYQNPNECYVMIHNKIPQTGVLPQSIYVLE